MENLYLRGYASYNFIGELTMSDKSEDVLSKGETKPKDNKKPMKWVRLNMGVKAGTNTAYVELFGMDRETINLKVGDSTEYVAYDRHEANENEEIKEQVKNKFRLKLNPSKQEIDGKERTVYEVDETYLDEMSMLEALVPHLKRLKGKDVMIFGTPNLNMYNGKTSYRYPIKGLIELSEEHDMQHDLTMEVPSVITKASLEKIPEFDKFKETSPSERKYDLDAWVSFYNSNIKCNELVPMSFKINLTGLDIECEKTPMYLKALNMMFSKDEEGKPLNGKKYYEGVLLVKYVNGREAVLELTETDKMLIECGMTTEAQIAKEKGVAGSRTTELQVTRLKAGAFLSEIEIDEDKNFYIEEKDEVVNKEKEAKSDFDLGI